MNAAKLPTWAEQMKALEPVADKVIAKWGRPNLSEAERQDMYTLALAILSEGYLCHVYQDPNRPNWAPLWNIAYNQGGPVPDYMYMVSSIDPGGTYKISGFRGTSRFVELTQQSWEMLTSMKGQKPAAATHDLDDLKQGKDGYFSVILSPERPAGYAGDWWQLHPGTVKLLMRKCSCDWKNELDARVAISRLDRSPPPTMQDIARRFSELPAWIEGMISFDMELVKHYRQHHGVNTLLRSQVVATVGGLPNQVYFDGIYEIGDDEALIIDTALPKKVRYWQTLVADDRFSTVDWVNRQSSLNDVQAKVDSDGRFRAVISARDPGVHNWLDKADNKWGMIQLRWNKATDHPDPELKRVKLADVRRHLPADTPTVTPEQRKELLQERREAAQLRILW